MWCPRTESNRGPIDYKSIALPAELQGHLVDELIFSLKDQINQPLKKIALIYAAVVPLGFVLKGYLNIFVYAIKNSLKFIF